MQSPSGPKVYPGKANVAMPGKTVKECLAMLGEGVDAAALQQAQLTEQWAMIKRAYFRKVLTTHPDKGGDTEVFHQA